MKCFILLALFTLCGMATAACQTKYCSTTVKYQSCTGWWLWETCKTKEKEKCVYCAVNGGWSSWSEYYTTACNASCGGGSQTVYYRRTCTNPAPKNGGSKCSGPTTQTKADTCNSQACPVNGGWSSWSQYNTTACSASCGGGSKTVYYSRTCTNPTPKNGGSQCSGLSYKKETPTCNSQACPVNGGWSSWSQYNTTTCSASCGGGSKTVYYSRTCTNPTPKNGGSQCSGLSYKKETPTCNSQACPVDGGWTDFVETESDCNAECGGGVKVVTSQRTCTNPAPENGGKDCAGDAVTTRNEACNEDPCAPVNGGWTKFYTTDTTECSITCGGGGFENMTRERSCTNPAPAYGGLDCKGDSIRFVLKSCGKRSCPIDGGWTDFTVWKESKCSAECEGGVKNVTYERTCTNPAPMYGGSRCSGGSKKIETEACNSHECPVNGGWTRYSETGRTECNVTCGGGGFIRITKERTCTDPAPAHGGEACEGDAIQTTWKACGEDSCPIDGGWTDFTAWKEKKCSVKCGGGVKKVTYRRTCTNPAPMYGGSRCSGESRKVEIEACNSHECPVNDEWIGYSETGRTECNVTCGGGGFIGITMERTCEDCEGDAIKTALEACGQDPCPIGGGWTDFTVWKEKKCSVECGGGEKKVTYERTCTNPTPMYGGSRCSGDSQKSETEACNSHECPVNGGWTRSSETGRTECNVTCGGGGFIGITKERTCTDPAPAHGGEACEGDAIQTTWKACGEDSCPIDGGWTDFTVWKENKCSAECGGGEKKVTYERTCTNPAPMYGGSRCSGDSEKLETEPCNSHECPVNGGWTRYSETGRTECNVTCGGGGFIGITKERTCTDPAPAHGGEPCEGDAIKTTWTACGEGHCPIDGGWTDFTFWKEKKCSVKCGGGEKNVTYRRTCTNPAPMYGGSRCSGDSQKIEIEACNSHECPVDGVWTDWEVTDITACTPKCGNGFIYTTSTRTCTNPAPQNGGKNCKGKDTKTTKERCSTACP